MLKLFLIYGSVFVSSCLRHPPRVHVNLLWGNFSRLPLPPCLLPWSGLLSSQRLINSTWHYFAGRGANLVFGEQVVNGCYSKILLHNPLPLYGFVFVFLSYPSDFSSSPSFLFCSLADFHLECTSNSLGTTSLSPAGLPKAIKYLAGRLEVSGG